METIIITLPTQLAAQARSLAQVRRQNLPDFLLLELKRVLLKKNGDRIISARRPSYKPRNLTQNSDQEVMRAANTRMEKWRALQMHRLIHQAGARQLSFEEQKILDTLLEIQNEIALRKARGIAEAIHRGLLPPMNDAFWSAARRQLMPRKKK